jgi:hypothetical protein
VFLGKLIHGGIAPREVSAECTPIGWFKLIEISNIESLRISL